MIIFLLLLGCIRTYPLEVAKELSNCNLSNYYLAGITDKCEISDCVSEVAVRFKNPGICDELSESIRDCFSPNPHAFYSPRKACYENYAINYSDPSVCQSSYCILSVASKTGNVSTCFALEDRNITDCFMIVGKKSCVNRTSYQRTYCIKYVAVNNANLSLCSYIDDAERRSSCESEINTS
jgi:hypothetical protein